MAARANLFPPFSDPKLPLLPKTFSPSLHFAKNLFSLAKPYPPVPLKSKHRNRLPSHIRCFRCGNRGNLVKNCYVPVRCYNCEGAGHKSSHRLKKPNSRSNFSLKPAMVCDDSRVLMNAKGLDYLDIMDKMLLDPDVEACEKEILDPASELRAGPKASNLGGLASCDLVDKSVLGDVSLMKFPVKDWGPEDACQSVLGDVSLLWSYPISEPYPQGQLEEFCNPISSSSSSLSIGCPVHLDLNPVPFSLISDIIIENEFEDYLSEVEEDSLNHLVKISSSTEVHRSSGKETWAHMDQPKFIIYCRFQAVDGFSRLEHARARGSKTLSPFRPKLTNESPEATVQVQELDSSGKSKKSPKSSKRGQQPIMLCCVRRSPRLNKGNTGRR